MKKLPGALDVQKLPVALDVQKLPVALDVQKLPEKVIANPLPTLVVENKNLEAVRNIPSPKISLPLEVNAVKALEERSVPTPQNESGDVVKVGTQEIDLNSQSSVLKGIN